MIHRALCAILFIAGCSGSIGTTRTDAAAGDSAQAREDAPAGPMQDSATPRPDAGPLPVVDPNCPAGSVFCESFEGDQLDPARWAIGAMAGGIQLDTTIGADGTHSLHAHMGPDVRDPQTAKLMVGIPAPDDRLYVRWYMRYGDLRLPGYHPNIVNVVGPDYRIEDWPNYSTLSFGTFGGAFSVNGLGQGLDGAWRWTEGDEFETAGDATPDTEHDLRASEWFCVELMVFGDHQGEGDTSHPNEEMQVFIEGAEITELHSDDERWAIFSPVEHWSPIYDRSIWTFGVAGAYTNEFVIDIWFDRIVFSPSRIGCD